MGHRDNLPGATATPPQFGKGADALNVRSIIDAAIMIWRR